MLPACLVEQVAPHTYRLWVRAALAQIAGVEGVIAVYHLAEGLYVVTLSRRCDAGVVVGAIRRLAGGAGQ